MCNPIVVVEFKRCRFSPRMLNIREVDIASEHGRSENCSFSCKFVMLFNAIGADAVEYHECAWLSISKAHSQYGCQYRSFNTSLENSAVHQRNDSWVIINFFLVLYARRFCGRCREKVGIDRRHGQCPANGRDLLHSLWLCIDLRFLMTSFVSRNTSKE